MIGGREVDFTYGECQAEMDMINRAYIECDDRGRRQGPRVHLPIPTYNMTTDFDWDSPNADLLFTMTAKYGLPYFQNFLNSELKPNMIRSMCCRLQLTCASCSSAATACSARPSRPARWAWSPSTARAWATCLRATKPALLAGSTACWSWAATAWRSSAR